MGKSNTYKESIDWMRENVSDHINKVLQAFVGKVDGSYISGSLVSPIWYVSEEDMFLNIIFNVMLDTTHGGHNFIFDNRILLYINY